MSDGFSDLQEFVMGVLVRERKTALNTIADADLIIETLLDRCARIAEPVDPVLASVIRKSSER